MRRPLQSPPREGALRLRARLERLSRNLWWTWHRDADDLWARVAAPLAETRRRVLLQNPVVLIRALGERHLARLARDAETGRLLDRVEEEFEKATGPAAAPEGLSRSSPVAYLSMEFGLHESLPIYAGGLGILAGDHIKSASDTGVPLVGVTLLYRCGYFRQLLDPRGVQEVAFPRADFTRMPLEVVRDRRGDELRVEVELPGRTVAVRVWRLAVGRRSLYLLDTDIPENSRRDRAISYRLYVGDREARIAQEVVLGIGAVRALRALGIAPGAWHLNEGHVAFQSLERFRELREKSGLSVAEALEAVAANTVFTTHTPVPEGNEVFALDLAERYLRLPCEQAGIPVHEYLKLGLDHGWGMPLFSLTVLALRLSRFRNGVSALHGEVSRGMWSKLWPGFAAWEAPITSVTNGVHLQTWVAPQLDRLYRRHVGPDWAARVGDASSWRKVRRIPDEALWSAKAELKRELVELVRQRTRRRLERYGWDPARARRETEDLLDPEALTIGFARRFALYKRAGLLFRDLERAESLFSRAGRPLQIIFAGKPHPEDAHGKRLIEEVGAIARRSRLRRRVVVLEDYDTAIARAMVRGVDVWLNNPRRPQEASGTSGQKVPVNCGLNLSILDGWWYEGYAPEVGWAFGKPIQYEDPDLQDHEDHADLLRVLEHEVVPLYFDRDSGGIPRAWMRKVKAGLERLVPRFSTHHMVLEYAEKLYRPAFENGRLVREGRWRLARELAEWREEVGRSWPLVHVRGTKRPEPPRKNGGARGTRREEAEVELYLGSLDPSAVAFCDSRGDLIPVERFREVSAGVHSFRIEVPQRNGKRSLDGGRSQVRVFPTHPELVHPHELGLSHEFSL